MQMNSLSGSLAKLEAGLSEDLARKGPPGPVPDYLPHGGAVSPAAGRGSDSVADRAARPPSGPASEAPEIPPENESVNLKNAFSLL